MRAARAGRPRAHRPQSLEEAPWASDEGRPAGLALPVPGRWRVSCGYRCNLHLGLHTYALDLVREDGPTAGTPVFSPVDGEVVAVVDGTVAHCPTGPVYGKQAGATLVLRFWEEGQEKRLRLVHLAGETVPQHLRPHSVPVPVTAGTYLGSLAYIAPGCAHLHIALTAMREGQEHPLPLTIAGRYLPDCRHATCWEGLALSAP